MSAVPSLLNTKLQNKNKHNQLYRAKKRLKHGNIIYANTQPFHSFSRNNSKAESNQTIIDTKSKSDQFDIANEQSYHSKRNKKRNSHCCNPLCLKICLTLGCLFLLLGTILSLSLALGLILSSNSNHISVTMITTTTTVQGLQLLTDTNEITIGLWNTIAGGNQTISTPGLCVGCYFPPQMPENAFDQNINTKYTHFGSCGVSVYSPTCGINTGIYIPLRRGSSLLLAFRFCTANSLSGRDPLTVTIEGSNQPYSAFILSSSWTLIYNGSTGLDIDPGRSSYGIMQNLTSNTAWYKSYRILISSKRNVINDAIQYGEIELFGI